LTYTVGAVQVFLNGVLLNASDYTASNGTSVVLASACLSGDIVEFIVISGGSVAVTGITVGSTVISGGSTGRVLYDNAGLVGEIAAGTSGNVLTSNGTSWSSATAAPTYGYQRNRIINGSMVIDQRNAGASGTAIGYTIDRWLYSASQTSKGTWGQNLNSVTTAVSFPNYLGFQSSSAYSVAAGDYFAFTQYIEGYNFADFGFGTASAQTITLSFSVYSSLTGTFGGALRNFAGTRSYPFSYSIPTASTWTSISVTIPGDTSGTWVGNTNAGAIILHLSFGVGSTFSGTTGSWSGGNYISATGAVSVVGTNGATFYATGVQFEAGSLATPFERLPYGETLLLCQRYYWSLGRAVATGGATAAGYGFTALLPMEFKVTMRTTPSVAFPLGSNGNITAAGATNIGPGGCDLYVATNGAAANYFNATWNSGTASAEL
jgi:hypothetical protein